MEDPLPPLVGLPLALLLVLLNGFFVAAEFAIVKVRQTRLQELEAAGSRSAGRARGIVRHLDAYLAATQLGITMASLGLGWLGEPAVASVLEAPLQGAGLGQEAIEVIAFALAFATITVFHITLGELAPKSLAILNPERVAIATALPLDLFYRAMRPAIWLLNGAANQLLRVVGLRVASENELAHSEEELRLLLASSAAQGVLDPVEGELASRSLILGELTVRDLMVPRTKIEALSARMSRGRARERMLATGRARLPVYRKGLDDVIGVIDWAHLFRSDADDWRKEVEPILVLPEGMGATAALSRLRDEPAPEALIIDEHGGTEGLLTMSALVHELSGRRDALPFPTAVDGEAHIRTLERALATTFPSTGATTLAGFLAERLGHWPTVGETVEIAGFRFTIQVAAGHRVDRVDIARTG
jgi:CBS domain containing-hemolysin-like protein